MYREDMHRQALFEEIKRKALVNETALNSLNTAFQGVVTSINQLLDRLVALEGRVIGIELRQAELQRKFNDHAGDMA